VHVLILSLDLGCYCNIIEQQRTSSERGLIDTDAVDGRQSRFPDHLGATAGVGGDESVDEGA
jgi:hypothetical protein